MKLLLYKYSLKKIFLLLCSDLLASIDIYLIIEFSTDWDFIGEKEHILFDISLGFLIVALIAVYFYLLSYLKDIFSNKKRLIYISSYLVALNILGLCFLFISLILSSRELYKYKIYSEFILILMLVILSLLGYVFQYTLWCTIIIRLKFETYDSFSQYNTLKSFEN